jgi:multicomponent Na+:H+ antiporter subunit D
MFRFDVQVFLPHLDGYGLSFGTLIMPLAVLAFLVGSAVAVFEGNLKRLLGYSSVAQIGYILLGISLLSTLGVTAGVLHVFNHALIKGTLFMAVACLAFRNGSVRLVDLAGCARSMPWTMGAFVVAGLSVVGVPLTAGFVSKWYLVLACLEYGNLGYLFAALVLASSLMALVYVWRVVEIAYFQPRPEDAVELVEAPLVMLVPLWILALANVWFGVDTSFSVGMAQAAAAILLGPSQ